ncbi:hypothetical protein TNCV_517261 [Trichonephila clavipes]|nr:hypothetical protein TNCV_517261 [Trichonephila clavipes]
MDFLSSQGKRPSAPPTTLVAESRTSWLKNSSQQKKKIHSLRSVTFKNLITLTEGVKCAVHCKPKAKRLAVFVEMATNAGTLS